MIHAINYNKGEAFAISRKYNTKTAYERGRVDCVIEYSEADIVDESSNMSIKVLAEIIAEIGGKKVIIDLPFEQEKAGFNIVIKSVFQLVNLNN